MREIAWTSKSLRAFKRLIRKHPELRTLIENTLKQLAQDLFNPNLRTHKLTGELSDIWSCSINYSHRILFEFVSKQKTGEQGILLLNIGTHDEVY